MINSDRLGRELVDHAAEAGRDRGERLPFAAYATEIVEIGNDRRVKTTRLRVSRSVWKTDADQASNLAFRVRSDERSYIMMQMIFSDAM